MYRSWFNIDYLTIITLNRTEYPQSSTGEESHDNDGKEMKDEDGPDEFEKSLFQFCRGLTSDDREEYDTFKGQEYEDSSAQVIWNSALFIYNVRQRAMIDWGQRLFALHFLVAIVTGFEVAKCNAVGGQREGRNGTPDHLTQPCWKQYNAWP